MYTPTTQQLGISSVKAPAEFIPADIPVVWQELSALLYPAVELSQGMLSLEQIEVWLRSGQATAFAVIEKQQLKMAVIAMPVEYAFYNAARIVALAGEDLKESWKFLPVLEAWALTRNCVEIEGWCREEIWRMLRPLGWTKKTNILSWDLRRKLQ